MNDSIKEIIRKRKSVRTFDGKKLSEHDIQNLETYIDSLQNPFRVPITFRVLDAAEYGLSSAVIVGEHTYLAAKVKKIPDHEMAFGYSFEAACLYALSEGIGTVMLAASLSRKAFENAMEVSDGEVLPVASPIGYPAEKRSIREGMMRKALKADTRKPFDEIYFDGSFEKTLTPDTAGSYAEALELARWAPSAGNVQPWRAVLDGDRVHFFEAKSMKDNALGDIQKVDVGIALAHFDLALQADGINGSFVSADPGFVLPDKIHYMTTYVREK